MALVSASLVLYNTPESEFGPVVSAFLRCSVSGEISVVDNSPSPTDFGLISNPRVRYFHLPQNVGFGAAHNFGFAAVGCASDFHLVINPDITFRASDLVGLVLFMMSHPDVGVVMPQVVYPNGDIQRLAKLLPSPLHLFGRRFFPQAFVDRFINFDYELRGLSYDVPVEVPSLSGCFLLIRSSLFRLLGGFDQRYFMYMEDVDLVRRIADRSRVMLVPQFSVCHGYAKGSYRNPALFKYHLISAWKYFFKWGWIFDATRRMRNRSVLRELR